MPPIALRHGVRGPVWAGHYRFRYGTDSWWWQMAVTPLAKRQTISALDTEIIRFLNRFRFARSYQVVAWTGASPWSVRDRTQRMAREGLLQRWTTTAPLRDRSGTVRHTTCSVWGTTYKGVALAGGWVVPGTEGQVVALPVGRWSTNTAERTLAAADLACWYRRYGFLVAAEREITSIELGGPSGQHAASPVHWTVMRRTGRRRHVPTLGVVNPDGRKLAVELDTTPRPVNDYEETVDAYVRARMGHFWHLRSQGSARRLMEACRNLGIGFAPYGAGGVVVSEDGTIRMQLWLPGRSGLKDPRLWADRIPQVAPGGLSHARIDVAAAWRTGEAVNYERLDLWDWV